MTTGSSMPFQRVLELLERYGLMLVSDASLPSIAGLVAGEPVRGSWWAHPKGKEIYDALLILNRQFEARGRLPWLADPP